MRKILLLLFSFTICYIVKAQDNIPCGFQRLFTFEPGMNKMIVMDSVNKTYSPTILNRQVEKLPPYKGTRGDSITKETVVYKIDVTPCFKGHDSKLLLEFADDKLFKAYLSTVYSKSTYNELISNFNSLRNSIKPYWQFENETKQSGTNMIGFGYEYSKTKEVTTKIEKVSLLYVDLKTDDPGSPYLLEVVWVNLANTRMESSNY